MSNIKNLFLLSNHYSNSTSNSIFLTKFKKPSTMGRKLPFLPTCGSPKTLSFRAAAASATATATTTTTVTEFDDMFATRDMTSSEIRSLSSDRFFFNPGKTSSILEEAKPNNKEKENVQPFKESVSMMEMQSTDPFVDFKKSMQEMLEADSGLKEWDNLQELLSLYLTVNDKINHCYIIGAFVDLLLVNLPSPLSSTSSSSCSSSSPSSSNISQEKSLLKETASTSCINNKNKMICGESTESALSFTSSSASSSGTCSLEEDAEQNNNHGDEENFRSPQKSSVSDY